MAFPSHFLGAVFVGHLSASCLRSQCEVVKKSPEVEWQIKFALQSEKKGTVSVSLDPQGSGRESQTNKRTNKQKLTSSAEGYASRDYDDFMTTNLGGWLQTLPEGVRGIKI